MHPAIAPDAPTSGASECGNDAMWTSAAATPEVRYRTEKSGRPYASSRKGPER